MTTVEEAAKVVKSNELAGHVGDTVALRGWLYNKRSSGKLHFLEVRDGFGIVQCVMSKKAVDEEAFAAAGDLTQETSILVTGEVKAHPKKPGVYELGVAALEVIATTADQYPISPKEHGTEFLMDHRHLWIRSKKQHAILRVRHAIVKAIRDFFDDRDFTLVDCLLYTSPSPRDRSLSRMPSSA